MIKAWATESGLTLGQMAFDDKSNVLTAIPEFLKILDIEGCIVTLDTMGCQRSIV